MKHISPIMAEQYLNNKTGLIQRTRIRKHLCKCNECEKLVHDTQANINLANELKSVIIDITDETSDSLAEQTEQSIRNKLELKI